MYKHILIPTDGSEASLRAVDQGTALAKALGAQLTLLTAIEPFPFGVTSVVAGAPDNPMRQAAREAANHWLNASQVVVAKHGVVAGQMVVESPSVFQSILEGAESCGADLIVMGTHGAGALERLLVGSQTQKVLARTRLPVLVMH